LQKNIRRVRLLSLVAGIALVQAAFSQEPITYRVGVFSFYPAIYAQDDGTIGGFYTDMLKEIEAREAVRFEYVYGSWDEGLQRLKNGTVDMLTSVAKTAERESYMTFGEVPLLTVWGELCVRKPSEFPEHSEIKTVTDLNGKTVAVMINDFNAQSFRSYIEKFDVSCRYLEVPDFRSVLAAVRDKEADAGVVSALVGDSLQGEYGLVSSGLAFNPFDIYFTVARGKHAALIRMLDKYLIEWKQNPASVYYSARLQWGHGAERTRIPSWLRTVLIALAAVLILAAAFIILLRLRVRAVTRALAESKDMLKLILNSTAEGIYGVDGEGNCVFCNASALAMLGYRAEEELLGRNIHERVHLSPGHAGADEDPCDLDGNRNVKIHVRERFFYRADGAPLPVEVWSWPLYGPRGFNGAVITFYDSTEQKRAEADRIGRAAAERANKAKSAFLANMSHELRTPLNSVIVLSNVLGRRLAGKIPEEEHSYLGVIERNGKRLLGLINEVLDLTRIEAGRERVNAVEFAIDALVNEIVETIAPQAMEKNIRLLLTLAPDIPPLRTDREKCMHVIMNLAGNAVKFTDTGSVSVTVGVSGHACVIEVADTGIGISEEFLPRAFEEFSQGDESASRQRKGTGLGLAIAKRYAILLGGDITVESREGEGSRFVFTFPLEYRPEGGALDSPLGKAFAPPGKERAILPGDSSRPIILIVEDNPDNRLTAKSLLQEGYRLLEAENGEEGIAAARRFKPDLILMDLSMPVMDGFIALKRLKEDPETADIPVIAVSSSAMKGDPESIIRRGFTGYIPKPLNPDTFAEDIRRILE